MKKIEQLLAGNLVLASIAGISIVICSSIIGFKNDNHNRKKVMAEDYITNETFNMFADVPPNPLIPSD